MRQSREGFDYDVQRDYDIDLFTREGTACERAPPAANSAILGLVRSFARNRDERECMLSKAIASQIRRLLW